MEQQEAVVNKLSQGERQTPADGTLLCCQKDPSQGMPSEVGLWLRDGGFW